VVHMSFDSLVGAVESTGWWRSHRAYIVDSSGKVLASNLAAKGKKFAKDAADPDSLEESTLKEMEKMPFGTIFGEGFPPKEVSGFYKLQEAPWTLVIIAPGDEVLSAILRFQALYIVTGVTFIVVILVLIRLVAGRVVSSIHKVARAADQVAGGRYDIALETDSRDEIGDLFQSFNRMVVQLEERARMKSALNLAMEVQQNLLPQETARFDFLDIAGRSVYCDEVGGDYYDFLQIPLWGPDCIGVAVGDVTGHGVPAALLMTTARALISSHAEQQRNLAAIVDEVNRLLCRDTSSSGHFMTLFFMALDSAKGEIRWVRAGHDPALVYDPAADAFIELGGDGMALGVDPDFDYTENVYSDWTGGQIAVVATDGVWETEGEGGERFGKQRLQETVRRHRDQPAAEILAAAVEEVAAFRKAEKAEDDVTLVIVKALEASAGKGEQP
jgi:sigma-B regulation protein RsbU (phosphoserine phosphatase)